MINIINKYLKQYYELHNLELISYINKCDYNIAEDKEFYVCQYFYCPDNCLFNNKKIMYIGQEANSWYNDLNKDHDVTEGMNLTKRFLEEGAVNSPFWNFIREFDNIFNNQQNNYEFNIFYSNIFRISNGMVSKKLLNYSKFVNEYLINIQTLSNEIKIFNPEIILFLSGPNYDKYINIIYNNLIFEQVDIQYNTRELARLHHKDLPYDTFRIYHPGYLIRNKIKYWEPLINIFKKIFINNL